MRLLHIFPVAPGVDVLDAADQGLAHSYLLGYAEKYADFPFEYRIIHQDVEKVLEEYKPDIVGITAMTYNFHTAAEIATLANKSGAKVVVGAHHLSNMPRQLTTDMDIGVLGEGEVTYLELLKLYRENKWEPQYLREVDGIVFRDEANQIHITPPRAPIKDLDSIGHPLREAAPLTNSTQNSILTSRGCPYNCVFCSQTRFWSRSVRFHSPKYVIEEIERAHRFSGTKDIRIDDGIFLLNKRRLYSILEMWEKHPLRKQIRFVCWGRANLMDEEMADIAVRIGVRVVQFGFESNDPEILTYLKGKSVTPGDNQRAYDVLTKRGIEVNANLIIGSPKEIREQIMKTYDFVKRNPLLMCCTHYLMPMPGTPVWEDAIERGLVSENIDFSVIGGVQLVENSIFLSETLSADEIKTLIHMFDALDLKHRRSVKIRRFFNYARTRPWVIPGKALRHLRNLTRAQKSQSGNV